jgi:hypothetical protein
MQELKSKELICHSSMVMVLVPHQFQVGIMHKELASFSERFKEEQDKQDRMVKA